MSLRPTRAGMVLSSLLLSACAAPAVAPNTSAIVRHAHERTIRYCSGTVTHFDIDRCIYELTPAQQMKREFSQRLTFEGNKLVLFEEINAHGALVERNNGIAASLIDYTNGTLTSWKETNRNGVLIGHTRLRADSKWARWVDDKERPRVKERSSASGIIRKFSPQGRVVSYMYVDVTGRPARADTGVFEVRPVRNPMGALTDERYFDQGGTPILNSNEVHHEHYEVDAMGMPAITTYFDTDERPALNKHGVHKVVSHLDAVGNLMGDSYFDRKGQPVRSKESGSAGYRIERNATGDELARTYLDENGKPMVCDYGYVTRRAVRNSNGDGIRWSYHGLPPRASRTERFESVCGASYSASNFQNPRRIARCSESSLASHLDLSP